MSVPDDIQLLDQLQLGDKKAFSQAFSRYYKDLVIFANTFTKEVEVAEEIVQEVFVKVWENREFIHISLSLKSYLLKATQNKCLDWLKHRKIKDHFQKIASSHAILSENDTEQYILFSELQTRLEDALNSLPVEVAEAFRLSRFGGLTYQEIAEKQSIAVRTVEVRITGALKHLRVALKDYLWFFSFIL